jgi:LytS/YehU family sensor histidine kinase
MSTKLNSLDAILVFLGFLIAVSAAIVIKKIFYYFRYKQRVYIFPRISVKGIANIAMVISIAIATLLLLTVVSAGLLGVLFRAYPGFRVTIESVLIKVGGLLFGPIIGIFIGAVTDLLSVGLTAGMFHYGYFVAAMVYGLLAGIIKTIINISKGKQVRFAFISTILVSLVGIASFLYILLQPQPYEIHFIATFYIKQ